MKKLNFCKHAYYRTFVGEYPAFCDNSYLDKYSFGHYHIHKPPQLPKIMKGLQLYSTYKKQWHLTNQT